MVSELAQPLKAPSTFQPTKTCPVPGAGHHRRHRALVVRSRPGRGNRARTIGTGRQGEGHHRTGDGERTGGIGDEVGVGGGPGAGDWVSPGRAILHGGAGAGRLRGEHDLRIVARQQTGHGEGEGRIGRADVAGLVVGSDGQRQLPDNIADGERTGGIGDLVGVGGGSSAGDWVGPGRAVLHGGTGAGRLRGERGLRRVVALQPGQAEVNAGSASPTSRALSSALSPSTRPCLPSACRACRR